MTGGTIWITGLPSSGKTTLSSKLADSLREQGYACALLDGEALRQRLGGRHGHLLDDRFAVLREIVAAAQEETRRGMIPIVATISHKRDMRRLARQTLGRMLEVYLDCAAEVCASRDRKDHYRRAHAGEYACFVGVTEPYETWPEADLVIDTAHSSIAAAASALLAASLEFLGASGAEVPALCR